MKHDHLFPSLLSLFSLLIIAVSVHSQTAGPNVVQLGARKLTLPPPDGFVEVLNRYKGVTDRLKATEDPGNEILSIAVPESFTKNLDVSQDIDLEFYTKISVSKSSKATDTSPEFYAAVVKEMEKNFSTYFSPDSAVMKDMEKNSSKGLTELLGEKVTVNVGGTTPLGFFEKTDNVFSSMLLVNLEVYGRKLAILGTLSLVRVNQKLIFVYTYKMSPKAEDVKTLGDFAKKWTAKILTANK